MEIIRIFSGLVNPLDANEAEVFALLIGCHELLGMGGFNPLLEVILFLLFNGDLGRPFIFGVWRLANWVEEVQDISRQITILLITLREAHEIVFRSSNYFDV
eukprot:TRINITY_DN21462_c0_g1_i1.p1 TRINITY_DN21462_c0_g1~~TRINITY_DN21462_c0_g1_i1.p1  ORF type:complete len:102 (+),score=15.12 TRINITY_DN21462_c0_g1_i1:109-414(+)